MFSVRFMASTEDKPTQHGGPSFPLTTSHPPPPPKTIFHHHHAHVPTSSPVAQAGPERGTSPICQLHAHDAVLGASIGTKFSDECVSIHRAKAPYYYCLQIQP